VIQIFYTSILVRVWFVLKHYPDSTIQLGYLYKNTAVSFVKFSRKYKNENFVSTLSTPHPIPFLKILSHLVTYMYYIPLLVPSMYSIPHLVLSLYSFPNLVPSEYSILAHLVPFMPGFPIFSTLLSSFYWTVRISHFPNHAMLQYSLYIVLAPLPHN
jgi:hypothetical protein